MAYQSPYQNEVSPDSFSQRPCKAVLLEFAEEVASLLEHMEKEKVQWNLYLHLYYGDTSFNGNYFSWSRRKCPYNPSIYGITSIKRIPLRGWGHFSSFNNRYLNLH